MPATGYYQQKTGSPSGFALVVLLHAAVFAALILIKGPEINRILHPPTVVTLIPTDPIPDPVRPPPQTARTEPHRTTITQTETVIELPPGTHTLQLVMGDADHIPHDPPVMSKRITINVRAAPAR